jgi:colanic acid/amylovoran biosynthesis glycosyltransferase
MMKDSRYLRISRGHRGDIYEEYTESRYLPLLKFTAQELDMIFFISENGRKYLENKTRVIRPEFSVSYLGVNGPEELKNLPENDEFTIISCSNIIPVKRIDMIIKALELLDTNKKTKWMHFGDGTLRKEIEVLAAKKLNGKRNITFSFMGYFANKDLLNYYENNRIDLFLNTSSSEGLPVSIMEAQSYGIPVIATDVGGVGEIVKERTGHLLRPLFDPAELKDLIIIYINMEAMEKEAMRIKAHNNWKQKFNAETNYSTFTAIIHDHLSRKIDIV